LRNLGIITKDGKFDQGCNSTLCILHEGTSTTGSSQLSYACERSCLLGPYGEDFVASSLGFFIAVVVGCVLKVWCSAFHSFRFALGGFGLLVVVLLFVIYP
jgi:hypothetical protein